MIYFLSHLLKYDDRFGISIFTDYLTRKIIFIKVKKYIYYLVIIKNVFINNNHYCHINYIVPIEEENLEILAHEKACK